MDITYITYNKQRDFDEIERRGLVRQDGLNKGFYSLKARDKYAICDKNAVFVTLWHDFEWQAWDEVSELFHFSRTREPNYLK